MLTRLTNYGYQSMNICWKITLTVKKQSIKKSVNLF